MSDNNLTHELVHVNTWTPDIRSEVPECPTPVIERYLIRTAIESCERARLWRWNVPEVPVIVGKTLYELETHSQQACIHSVIDVMLNGRRIRNDADEVGSRGQERFYSPQYGSPAYHVPDRGFIELTREPRENSRFLGTVVETPTEETGGTTTSGGDGALAAHIGNTFEILGALNAAQGTQGLNLHVQVDGTTDYFVNIDIANEGGISGAFNFYNFGEELNIYIQGQGLPFEVYNTGRRFVVISTDPTVESITVLPYDLIANPSGFINNVDLGLFGWYDNSGNNPPTTGSYFAPGGVDTVNRLISGRVHLDTPEGAIWTDPGFASLFFEIAGTTVPISILVQSDFVSIASALQTAFVTGGYPDATVIYDGSGFRIRIEDIMVSQSLNPDHFLFLFSTVDGDGLPLIPLLEERLLLPASEVVVEPEEPGILYKDIPGLEVCVSLKPGREALEIPKVLYKDYYELITKGTLARLMDMQDQLWSDQSKANKYKSEYEILLNRARQQVDRGFITGSQRIRPRKFI